MEGLEEFLKKMERMSSNELNQSKKTFCDQHIKSLWDQHIKYTRNNTNFKIAGLPQLQNKIMRWIQDSGNSDLSFTKNNLEGNYEFIKIIDSQGNGLNIRSFGGRVALFPSGKILQNSGWYIDRVEIDSLVICIQAYFYGMPEWLREVNSVSYQIDKIKKLRSMASNNIELWLNDLMKELDCYYYIKTEKNRSNLCVQFSHKKMLEIPIYHKNYQQNIPKVIKTIEIFKRAFKEAPLLLQLTSYGNNINWRKAK
jgi:hypothetical protein